MNGNPGMVEEPTHMKTINAAVPRQATLKTRVLDATRTHSLFLSYISCINFTFSLSLFF